MLAIRLSRFGKKRQPIYRIIVLEKSKDNFGDYLENLGHYNPRTKVCEVKKDRILYWISKGAKPTPTVHNLLVDQNVIKGPKVRAFTIKKKKKKKEEKTSIAEDQKKKEVKEDEKVESKDEKEQNSEKS
jgi:small subunit ribosomal protein S16